MKRHTASLSPAPLFDGFSGVDCGCPDDASRRLLVRTSARFHALFPLTLVLAGCSSVAFQYVELTGGNVEVLETDRPSVGYWPLGLHRIPIRYALQEPGLSLTLAVEDGGLPNLSIGSSVPIRAVSTEGANTLVVPLSPVEYRVTWWDKRVGDLIEVRIVLEHRVDPILISGVIADGGTIRDCACSL